MEQRIKVRELLETEPRGQEVVAMGWVRSFRNDQFIVLHDGSCPGPVQVVVDPATLDPAMASRLTTGASIRVMGNLVPSPGKGQRVEIRAKEVEVIGDCDPARYPLQPKKHSLEFLREIAHLRLRTNTFGSVFRIRHALAIAIHRFFDQRGFIYLHSPIITGSDAEGAGEMFRVTTLGFDHPPRKPEGGIDFREDFFGKPTHLTVSGQLEAELGAMAFGDVYTFGPTFRAENSNTARHLAEFWMIEPEMAFCDLEGNMDLAEALLKDLIRTVLEGHAADLEFLSGRLSEEERQRPMVERSPMGLTEKLRFCLDNAFERLTYTEAISILIASPDFKKKKFRYPVSWGVDLQSEHERYLVEQHFRKPVILTDYPKSIKAFYMRQNEDGKTVRAMDILFPGIGEMVGGSQREERLDRLEARMEELHLPREEMNWYLDSRRFGTCPHAGFGLGFERLVQFVTGMGNIRDVIPFPRTPKNASF